MRSVSLTRATLREIAEEILGQGVYGDHQSMAEHDATIATLEAVTIYLYGHHVKRDDVRDYMAAIHEADGLEKSMPQQYEAEKHHRLWAELKDGAEYRIAAIGARIVGTL